MPRLSSCWENWEHVPGAGSPDERGRTCTCHPRLALEGKPGPARELAHPDTVGVSDGSQTAAVPRPSKRSWKIEPFAPAVSPQSSMSHGIRPLRDGVWILLSCVASGTPVSVHISQGGVVLVAPSGKPSAGHPPGTQPGGLTSLLLVQ